jgi:hypothetical protein
LILKFEFILWLYQLKKEQKVEKKSNNTISDYPDQRFRFAQSVEDQPDHITSALFVALMLVKK